ncbi:maleylpyruvate isomerase family mycothiol-dependent enzyme [Nakamurella sp.]|uniref:maleylpyruvate isomerase family mycothiol-dependent enzyme n=1 Tax=Nakamurella sp. TaxID=1869182 RepID=UPI003784DD08
MLDLTDPLARATTAERERLVDLLTDAGPEQWAADSLCAGWRVREVVAHMTMPYRHTGETVMAGIAAHGGDFNSFADEQARQDTAALSDAELLASLRDNVRHPWQPPAGGQAGALSHDVIHGLDITEPLGLPRPPADRIGLVLAGAGPRQLAYFGVDLSGRRLVATDTDLVLGDGPVVTELPAADILLAVAGRTVLDPPIR